MFNVTSLSFNHSILQPLYTLQFEARAMMHCAHRPHALDRNTGISIMGLYNKMAAPLFRIHSMQTSYRMSSRHKPLFTLFLHGRVAMAINSRETSKRGIDRTHNTL